MKPAQTLPAILILLSLFACKKDEPDFPTEIDQVIETLTKSMDSLNTDLATNAIAIALNVSDTADIRSRLLTIYNNSSFATQVSFITPEGILQIIEPSEFYSSQGADISQQPHVVKAFQTKLPVLSQAFDLVEGYRAAVNFHPVLGTNQQVLGAVDAVFLPEEILGRIILPIVQGQTFEIWVMEKGGNLLFDLHTDQIGLNVITDPLYADFPELIAAAQKMDSELSNETTYSFYQTGTSNIVKKKAYWKTFEYLDNQWKIVWTEPI